MFTKKWYASKALWFNVLALVVAVAAEFGYSGELPAEWGVFVPAIVIVINLILRLFFTQSKLVK